MCHPTSEDLTVGIPTRIIQGLGWVEGITPTNQHPKGYKKHFNLNRVNDS